MSLLTIHFLPSNCVTGSFLTGAEPNFGLGVGAAAFDPGFEGTTDVPRRFGFLWVCISDVTFLRPRKCVNTCKIMSRVTFSNISTLINRCKQSRMINFGTRSRSRWWPRWWWWQWCSRRSWWWRRWRTATRWRFWLWGNRGPGTRRACWCSLKTKLQTQQISNSS